MFAMCITSFKELPSLAKVIFSYPNYYKTTVEISYIDTFLESLSFLPIVDTKFAEYLKKIFFLALDLYLCHIKG